ncbi:hypothetical protein D3C72_1981750 [compost metagenome]
MAERDLAGARHHRYAQRGDRVGQANDDGGDGPGIGVAKVQRDQRGQEAQDSDFHQMVLALATVNSPWGRMISTSTMMM